MKALIVKEDGLIYVNRVPEEPKFIDTMEAVENCWNDNAMSDYNKALASAKENAVLCADQEYAEDLICGWNNGFATNVKLTPGIYPIPDLKWEVKQYFTREGDPDVELAILTLSEQPKSHGFCVTPNSNCSMNYCDDNGCQDRRRELVEQPKEEESQEELTALNLKMFIERELGGYKTVHMGRSYRVINRQFVYESDIMSLAEDLLRNFTITRNQ